MITRVLVGIHGSDHASRELDLACALASRFGAELIALHVISDRPLSDAEREMAEVEFRAEIAQGFDVARLLDAKATCGS